MIETKEERVAFSDGERRVAVTKITAMRSVKLLTKLGRCVGSSLIALAHEDPRIVEEHLGEAVAQLFDRLTESEVESIIRELLFGQTQLEVNGKMLPLDKEIFELQYAGEMGALAKTLGFALKTNYSDFYGALAGLFARFVRANLAPSATSSTSAGKPSV
jgi:hypothetical protein